MNAHCAHAIADRAMTAGLGACRKQTAGCSGIDGSLRRVRAWPMSSWRMLLLAGLLVFGCRAFANDAQLILVAGDVKLQRVAPGQPAQTLVPGNGTLVQRGDSLVTGADGRVQIRFSDGSLVSLQPRSEFRIDDYQFDLDRQSGFFSLVRGALRTITGAVGKRDPDDYRMTTPTATIGIRGTEFLVEETVCTPACHPGRTAGLRVSVSAGHVVVFNAAGSMEVPAGNATYVAGAARAPVPTSDRPTMSTAPASFDPANPAGTTRLAGSMPGTGRAVADFSAVAADQQGRSLGERLSLATRAQSFRLALNTAEGIPAAVVDQWSIQGAPRQDEPTANSPVAPVAAAAIAGPGASAVTPAASLPVAAGKGKGAEASAEEEDDELITDETFDDPAQGSAGALEPAATPSSIAAIILSPSGDNSMTAAIGGSSGSNAQLDPAGMPVVIGAIGACQASGICSGGNPGGSGRDAIADDTSGGVGGSTDENNGTDTGNTGGGSTGGGSSGSGNTGAGNSGGGSTGGGSTGGGSTGGGSTGGGNTGGGNTGGAPILTPGLNRGDRIAIMTLQSPWFDLNTNAANAHVRLDSAYRLESIGLCPTVLCLSRNTAQVTEAGYNADVSWGRWVNGNARVTVLGFRSDRALGSNNGVHYLVGVPTVTMPNSGAAHYSLAGATSPTFASGAVAPGVFTGQGLVQFASGQSTQVGFKGDMVFGSGERYHLFSNGARTDAAGRLVEIGNTQIRMTGRTTFSGNIGVVSQGTADRLGCGGSNCQANLEGGFYGPGAARMGVGYSVGKPGGSGDTINGVAVLNRE